MTALLTALFLFQGPSCGFSPVLAQLLSIKFCDNKSVYYLLNFRKCFDSHRLHQIRTAILIQWVSSCGSFFLPESPASRDFWLLRYLLLPSRTIAHRRSSPRRYWVAVGYRLFLGLPFNLWVIVYLYLTTDIGYRTTFCCGFYFVKFSL